MQKAVGTESLSIQSRGSFAVWLELLLHPFDFTSLYFSTALAEIKYVY